MPRKLTAKGASRRALQEERRARTILGDRPSSAMHTQDSFQNLALKLGIGTDNGLSQSTYGYFPITRVRVLLEWIHRGSWLGGVAVDVVGNDMTRAGIDITSTMPTDNVKKIKQGMVDKGCWAALNDTIKWGRLYGGAICAPMIDGQDTSTPLRLETISKGQFKGLLVLDRWMVDAKLTDLVFDSAWGYVPKFYDTITLGTGIPRMTIHHSRVFRFEGVRLPYQQRLTENLWGLSIYERMYDRMVAFDSGTMGVAQSLYKSYLRYVKIKGFRELAATGGPALTGLIKFFELMRRFQSNEGISVLDMDDDFGVHQNQTFTGMSEGLLQLGQQLSGALQIPMVRLFGQSPAGLNATGESDLRTYYDGINAQQEVTMRSPLGMILRIVAADQGIKVPPDFNFKFMPLYVITGKERAETGEVITRTVGDAFERGMITQKTAMQELQQASHETGIFTNIGPEMIENAEDLIPTTLGGVDPETGELAIPAAPPEEESADGGEGVAASKKDSTKKKKARDALPFSVLGQRHFQGIPCVVEQPPGFNRRGEPQPGGAAYGYIQRTTGMDGDNVDCFFGSDEDCFMAWVINQGGDDPEHKVMLGFRRWGDALAAYGDAYPEYPLPGSVVGMTMPKFKEWLSDPLNHTRPAARASRAAQ